MPLPIIKRREDAVEELHIIESANEYGIAKDMRIEDGALITKHTYDASGLIEQAAAARAATAGDRWGDGHHVGTIPMAEYTRILETYKSAEERKHQILCWLRDNPKLVSFDKFLLKH